MRGQLLDDGLVNLYVAYTCQPCRSALCHAFTFDPCVYCSVVYTVLGPFENTWFNSKSAVAINRSSVYRARLALLFPVFGLRVKHSGVWHRP